ncbi:unnamed protein product [Ranitomeya imitator]|uniref:Uncharacterized protein n=1 Tax=Ranitomeya imitator TaxID=111125 RepID=A0ABN9LU13_9NEOB|nr:unnamed protein product [Ranitomeya imitator]
MAYRVGAAGNVKASSTITLRLWYNQRIEVKEQYEEMHSKVQAAIVSNQCNSRERCSGKISAEYLHFYKPHVSTFGLACVTSCAPGSPSFLDCNSGNCQIKGNEGPQCFCPETDLYLYTYARCQGAISIVAMYGGVGAGIGVLVIVSVILGVFLYRKKYYN